MASVDRVGQSLLEVAEVGTESVAVQEENVVRVDGSDGLFDSNVEVDQSGVLLIGGFVQGVEAGNPGVILVVSSEVLPDLDSSVLEVLVNPDCAACQRQIQRAIWVAYSWPGGFQRQRASRCFDLLGRRASQ